MASKSAKPFFDPVGIFLFALLYLYSGTNVGLIYLDDGAACLGAWNVLAGQVPYRDFMVIGGPGYFYLLALFFKLFGPQVVVERLLNWGMLSANVTLVFLITRQMASRVWSFVAAGIALVILGSFTHYPGAQPTAIFLSLVSLLVCLRLLTQNDRTKQTGAVYLCGLLSGLCVLFRQDVGAAVVAAQGLCFALSNRQQLKSYLFALASTLGLAAIFFFINIPADKLYFAFVEYPFQVYPRYAARAFPIGEGMISDKMMVILPFVVYPTAALVWFKNRRKKESADLLCVLVYGVLCLNQAFLRADSWHFIAMWLPSTVLTAYLAGMVWRAWGMVGRLMLVVVMGVFASMPVLIKGLTALENTWVPSAMERGKGIQYIPDSYGTDQTPGEFLHYENAIKYVMAHTKPGEKIFVGSRRHDRVCSADPLFYFLTDRPSAVYDYEMHRGLFTTQASQAEVINDLKTNQVRYVVLREILDTQCTEANESSKATGSTALDEYLRSSYKLAASFGTDHVFERA